MQQLTSSIQDRLLNLVKGAIVSSTQKRTALSSVRLATILQVNPADIEKYVDELVKDGRIIREQDREDYPPVVYRLPDSQ